jgi:hypothetical protein
MQSSKGKWVSCVYWPSTSVRRCQNMACTVHYTLAEVTAVTLIKQAHNPDKA